VLRQKSELSQEVKEVEQFATEEQQVEAIKRFWKDNGMAIIIGAVLGLGALWGWRYYSENQIVSKEAASLEYQAVVESLQNDGGIERATEFASEYADSGYAPLMGLILAQQAIDDNDFDKALDHLNTAASNGDEAVSALAYIRIARIQLAQNDADQALETAAKITGEAFTTQVETIKGDAYSLLADFAKARLAYSAAVDADQTNRTAKMKLDNLAVAAGS